MRAETESDFAINDVGDGFFEVFRHSEVTMYEVHAIMPFKNNVVVAKLTGVEIKKLIADLKKTALSGDATNLLETKSYSVAMVDHSAQSTYNLPPERYVDTGKDVRDIVVSYVSKQR